MKIIQNYTIKVIILIFCSVLALEICVCIFIYRNSTKIYKNLFDETLEKSSEKAKESMETVTKFVKNKIMSYITKLKLINKHIYLYNRNTYFTNKNTVNQNSAIFKNKNLEDKIIEAKTESIYAKKAFQKFFNETTEKFEYVEYYNKIYENITDNSLLLNKLLKEHEELNYISYYNFVYDVFDLRYLQEENIKELNFLIPILKSIFLEHFIIKREKMDIRRIFLITYYDLIIYPPEDAFQIDIYNPGFYAGTSYLKPNIFYYYIYESLYNSTIGIYGDLSLRLNYFSFNNLLYSLCIKSIYFKTYSFLCFDVNFGYLINSIGDLETKKFDFGFLKQIYFYVDENTSYFDYFVIYNTNRKVNEILEVFNSSDYIPDEFIIKENKNNYYSFYYVLYLDTTKILKTHPELNLNISVIKEEYDIIRQNIYDSFYGNKWDAIETNFNKTTCRKKLMSNEYECFICEIKMSYIFPFYLELQAIDFDVIDTNISNFFWLYSLPYSITYTCPETNAKDMEMLIKFKLIRIISFYFLIAFIIFCFYLLFINILSEYFFNNINDLINKMNLIAINENK